jgi:hypothetical protein
MPMALVCNPSYSGGSDQKDCSLVSLSKIVQETLSQKKKKKKNHKIVLVQGVGPEFKSQYCI